MKTTGAALMALLGAMVCAGCSIHAMTGDTMSEMAVHHTFPHTMSSADVDMACESGVSMGGFLMSFSRVTDNPHKANIVSMLSAAMCAEAEAGEAELRRLRALNEGRTGEAQDALIQEKQKHRLAAERNYAAFLNMRAAYGEPGEGCPEFEEEYPDELLYLLGLSSGMLAMVHDRHAGATAGIPMDLPPKIARAAGCVDTATWWGMPTALKAAIEVSIPGAGGEDGDPWADLKAAAEMGDAAGMSMPRALYIQTLSATGDHDAMCAALADFEANRNEVERVREYALLDAYGGALIRHEVNKDWTRAEGHRAPVETWTCVEIEEDDDDGGDDLLDDMLGSDEPEPTPPPADPNEETGTDARPEGETPEDPATGAAP